MSPLDRLSAVRQGWAVLRQYTPRHTGVHPGHGRLFPAAVLAVVFPLPPKARLVLSALPSRSRRSEEAAAGSQGGSGGGGGSSSRGGGRRKSLGWRRRSSKQAASRVLRLQLPGRRGEGRSTHSHPSSCRSGASDTTTASSVVSPGRLRFERQLQDRHHGRILRAASRGRPTLSDGMRALDLAKRRGQPVNFFEGNVHPFLNAAQLLRC